MKYFFFFITTVLLLGCAKVGRPTGGAKDEIPPISIKAKPDFETVNFNENKIKIYFDEYVKFKDLNKQLVVSPPLNYPLEITPLGTASKYISITIKDTLKKNTTYSFNFGNAIQDNSEGNPLEQFKYIFSTGSYLDSLSVLGSVKDAFLQAPLANISVLLYAVDSSYTDSIIYKQKPNYIANTLEGIDFSISNIKEGTYQLIALNDVSGDLIFDPKEDAIGFLNQPINIPTDSTYVLTISKEQPEFLVKKVTELSQNHILVAYVGGKKPIIENIYDKNRDIISFHSYKEKLTDSLHIWHHKIDSDTLYIAFNNKGIHSENVVRLRSKVKDSLVVSKNIATTLHLNDTLFIKTNLPISKIDTKQMILVDKDSIPVFFTTKLSASKTKFSIDYKKGFNQRYELTLLPNAIIDYNGIQNDSIKYSFSTKSLEDYGEIIIDVEKETTANLIVVLLNEDNKLISQKYCVKSQKISFPLLLPDKYKVRIIVDENNNDRWDSAVFLKKEQAELVIYLDKVIDLRANWSIEEKVKI